jgi:hypothetical protein
MCNTQKQSLLSRECYENLAIPLFLPFIIHGCPTIYKTKQFDHLIWQYHLALLQEFEGTAVAQWLSCCATNRKVAGSIPHGVTGIFY